MSKSSIAVAVLTLPLLLQPFAAIGTNSSPVENSPSQAAQLGRLIFMDTSLSASGRMSCATCHDPAHAHAQSNHLAVQMGGANDEEPGLRATPSIRYLKFNPPFSFGADGKPVGGFNRDGRAQSLAEQAVRPFLAAHEMANADRAEVGARLSHAAYAAQFRQLYGMEIFDDGERAFDRATAALQAFEQESAEFSPFDSKYDLFLAGKLKLDASERRGLAIFNDKKKGNCAACHPSAVGADKTPPLFTDFSYDTLGVPRNRHIPANNDPAYFDLGLCERPDLAQRAELCGAFKVPTLRNVATRKVFFHHGAFTDLREVLRYYGGRDTQPEKWYPRNGAAGAAKYDDLPKHYRKNVNSKEAPYGRSSGQEPAFNDAEIEDMLKFLGTLTDGYRPLP